MDLGIVVMRSFTSNSEAQAVWPGALCFIKQIIHISTYPYPHLVDVSIQKIEQKPHDEAEKEAEGTVLFSRTFSSTRNQS